MKSIGDLIAHDIIDMEDNFELDEDVTREEIAAAKGLLSKIQSGEREAAADCTPDELEYIAFVVFQWFNDDNWEKNHPTKDGEEV